MIGLERIGRLLARVGTLRNGGHLLFDAGLLVGPRPGRYGGEVLSAPRTPAHRERRRGRSAL